MIARKPIVVGFEIDDAKSMTSKVTLIQASSSNPAAGRDGQGARDLSERMDAILEPKTMAGSQDAGVALRPASCHLAHGFLFWGRPAFREPMKEDRNVQYSFSRDRLGWTSPQA